MHPILQALTSSLRALASILTICMHVCNLHVCVCANKVQFSSVLVHAYIYVKKNFK